MYKFFIFFLLVTSPLFAHQPDISSTMLIEKGSGQWVLQVRSAMTAYEYEIKYNDSNNKYSSPEEFQQLVIDHIKANVKLSFNGEDLILEDGQVKLGHETSVVFRIQGAFDSVQEIEIKQSTFSKINKNRSAFIVMKDGLKPQQFVLDDKNDHSTILYLENGKFESKIKSDSEPIDTSHNHYGRWALIGLALLSILGLFWYKIGGNRKRVG